MYTKQYNYWTHLSIDTTVNNYATINKSTRELKGIISQQSPIEHKLTIPFMDDLRPINIQ